MPIIMLPTVFFFFKVNIITIVKICIVYISFLTLSSVIAFVFSKNGFRKILVLLHDNYPYIMDKIEYEYSSSNRKRTKSLSFNLVLQLIPLVLVALVFTSLVSFVQASKRTNEVNYSFYKNLLSTVDTTSVKSKDIRIRNKHLFP